MILEHYLVARVLSYFDIFSGTVILNLSSPKQYEETSVFGKHERQTVHSFYLTDSHPGFIKIDCIR